MIEREMELGTVWQQSFFLMMQRLEHIQMIRRRNFVFDDHSYPSKTSSLYSDLMAFPLTSSKTFRRLYHIPYLHFQIPFLLHTCLYFKKIYSLLIPLNMLPFSSPLFSSLLKIVHILTASNKHPSPLFY